MSFISFLKSKVFWINVALSVVATVLLLSSVNWLLKFYTESGRTIIMPQLEGQTQKEVEEALSNNDMTLVLIDSVYNANARPGAIIDQQPKAGKKVKKGRTVYVSVNAWSKEMTKLPSLLECSYRNAVVNLETAGLKLGDVTRKPTSYGNDEVLEVSVNGKPVAAGTSLPKGTAVSLVISQLASGDMAPVPDLTGKTLRDAQLTAASAKFCLGTAIYDENVKTPLDTATAIVYRQAPKSTGALGSTLTPINVWLSNDVDKIIEEAE